MSQSEVESAIALFKTTVDDFDDSDNELHLLVSTQPLTSTEGIIKKRTLAGLLARLKTFSSLSWSVKPIELSPLVCAQYGWIGKKPNLLVCVTCKNNLCIKLPSDSKLYNHCLKEAIEKLSSNHDNLCPWKLFPAIDAEPVLKFTNPAQDFEILNSIADSLSCLANEIDDSLQFSIGVDADTAEDFLNCIAGAAATSSEVGSDEQLQIRRRQRCFQLAITGWSRPSPDSDELLKHFKSSQCPSILSCQFCLRRLGVWNLVRLANRQERQQHGEESTESEVNLSTGNLFNTDSNSHIGDQLEGGVEQSRDDADNDAVVSQSSEQPASKRARLSEAPATAAAKLELLSLHWLWCPWSSGQVTKAWCDSVLLASPKRRRRKPAIPTTTDQQQISTVAADGCAKVMQLLRSIV
ncbi:hypothetical protein BOX15_Mlig031850g1 [Macrostomum lignano]|uniref:C3HC-type domain-containing protein n=1 Tax=Macrostomum lignano TaxID=282301 RepID=A0A267GJW0_9PLAT|nr:hypothetical protein BOX15_Mlig031850g1 [Macrostomum lignano]